MERPRVLLLDFPRLQREILVELLGPSCRLLEAGGRRAVRRMLAGGGADVVVAGLPQDDLGALAWLTGAPPEVRVLVVARGGRLLLELLGELSPSALASALHGDPGGTAAHRAART